jgi:hypothetical protein
MRRSIAVATSAVALAGALADLFEARPVLEPPQRRVHARARVTAP